MLLTVETSTISNQFARLMREQFLCRVITFGIVAWNEKQKSRTSTRTIFSGNLSGMENYRLAAALFKNRWQQVAAKRNEPERYFVTTFSTRELIADNIAGGEVWYQNIADYMTRKETREQLFFERKELGRMVEEAKFDNERERLFIKVCHESWRRRLGKLGERATRENANFSSLVRKEAERWRTSLARCKNAETLRETVVDFWSRGGANEMLQGDGLMSLWPLFGEKTWRTAKDLALLALVSYQPQSREEGNITTLQKILWKNEVHTTVSAEAIRWALRYFWQRSKGKESVNRRWNEETAEHEWQDQTWKSWTSNDEVERSQPTFIDDDAMGFMLAEAASTDGNDTLDSLKDEKKKLDEEFKQLSKAEQKEAGGKSLKERIKLLNDQIKVMSQGTTDKRRGALEVTRAISLAPFAGDITFNAKSGKKTNVSLYGTEVHATRYQYGIALTPDSLREPTRVLDVIDAITGLSEVAGNQSRFLYDFAPESIVFRWAEDFAFLHEGVKATAENLKQQVRKDLGI